MDEKRITASDLTSDEYYKNKSRCLKNVEDAFGDLQDLLLGPAIDRALKIIAKHGYMSKPKDE